MTNESTNYLLTSLMDTYRIGYTILVPDFYQIDLSDFDEYTPRYQEAIQEFITTLLLNGFTAGEYDDYSETMCYYSPNREITIEVYY